MNVYKVMNQWGGPQAPWNDAGVWVLGSRHNEPIVAIDISSDDEGTTLRGTVTFRGQRPMRFRATRVYQDAYHVYTSYRNSSRWYDRGIWVIGDRADTNQYVEQLTATYNEAFNRLEGTMTYTGEGPIGFRAINLADNELV